MSNENLKGITVKIDEKSIEKVKEKLKKDIENLSVRYLGDVKWVLYKYVCSMNSEEIITFRCGKYAYDKIRNMNGFENCGNSGFLNLNGEDIRVYNVFGIAKNQIIISKEFEDMGTNDTKVYSNDIVLEFA